MTEKKTQRVWEQKLQVQQEELDKRELIIQSLEKKYQTMQTKAEEMLKRDERLKLREERVTTIELKEETLTAKGAEMEAAKTEAQQELERQRKITETLAKRIREFERDLVQQESELSQRGKDLDAKAQRLHKQEQDLHRKFEHELQELAERQSLLQTTEAEQKLRKVQLSEEQSNIQRMLMDLRNKDEEHETNEKLMKDMQLADERSRRHLKWQEDELMRQRAELRIHREDHTAEVAALENLKERIEADKRKSDKLLFDAKQLLAEAERKDHLMERRREDLDHRQSVLDEEESRLKVRWAKLEEKEKTLQADTQLVSKRRREAEIDLKRATHLRMKSSLQESSNISAQKKLQQKENSLNDWDDELDWRETEFAKSVEAAMCISHEVPSYSPSHMNKAIVDLQLQQMQQHYNTGSRRRVISALQPRNRATSAKKARGSSPLRKPRPNSSAPHVIQQRREQEQLAGSYRVSLQERSVVLERDFKFLIGKVAQAQEAAGTPEAKEELMRKHFSVEEQVTVQLALHRDRDLGSEIALRRTVKLCPIAHPVPSPVEMVERMQGWWTDLEDHLAARDEAILRERVDQLGEAVTILRKRCPQFVNLSRTSAGSAPTRRAVSATPRLRSSTTPSTPPLSTTPVTGSSP